MKVWAAIRWDIGCRLINAGARWPAPAWTLPRVATWSVLTASGVLDLSTAPTLRQVLTDLLAGGTPAVVADLSGVILLDCANIGVLVEAAAVARRRDAALHVVGARGRVSRILDITGVTVELGIDRPGPASASGVPARQASLETVEAVVAARSVLPATDGRATGAVAWWVTNR